MTLGGRELNMHVQLSSGARRLILALNPASILMYGNS